ncbi:SAM hydrolase/SAM-dependent halogenase family protein [Maridesulfovibrio zosterae]|uniref:SAM hydrolase/SAM-dependent halogenase family protein n=1 Tax=Maridesulfovibrio zosterae TaxID=82171 RepID=UPI0003F9ABD3|nr:SAM-dependent chlorinase/fluorinase [Maridesulfovibrio zosterae]
MSRTIGLLTDFGLDDPYVGQMKGVLAIHAPESYVIDVSHGVSPFCIAQGAFFLAAAMNHFPENTIFITVVDPGVGSGRKIIGAEFNERIVIAPDNGILELAESQFTGTMIVTDLSETAGKMSSSSTFHGRDLFAPLAAEIASGTSLENLGPKFPLRNLVRKGIQKPVWKNDEVKVIVLHKDRFGNLILNIPDKQIMPERMCISREKCNVCCVKRVSCYTELEDMSIGLLAGSQGFYELALKRGSASEMLGVEPEDTLILKWSGQCEKG